MSILLVSSRSTQASAPHYFGQPEYVAAAADDGGGGVENCANGENCDDPRVA